MRSVCSLLFLTTIVSAPVAAETFVLGQLGNSHGASPLNPSRPGVMCRDETTPRRHCQNDDTVENLYYPVYLEVSCRSEFIRITAPVHPHREYGDMVRVMHRGRATEMPLRVAWQLKSDGGNVGRAYMLTKPIDVWIGPAGDPDVNPTGGECGGVPYRSIPRRQCQAMEDSEGPIEWPNLEPPISFDLTREWLWKYLEMRKYQALAFDNSESGETESALMEVHLYQVSNPAVLKMKDRRGQIKRTDFRHGAPAGEFLLFGETHWRDIKVRPSYGGELFSRVPGDLLGELNRLQDFYDACEANASKTEVSDAPMSSAATAARSAVRVLRDDFEEWNRWKDTTLERFADTE